MAKKQNLQQEVEAMLMEAQQIFEDQRFGGIYDEDREEYLEYIEKKREQEWAETAFYEDFDLDDFIYDDDEGDDATFYEDFEPDDEDEECEVY